MKKIRILTFWNVPNYGGFLQAYALQKFLEGRYKDWDVKQLAYLHPKHYNMYYGINKNFKKWLINPKFYISSFERIKKRAEYVKTKRFLEYYHLIPSEDIYEFVTRDGSEMDILVLGSDIIWDFSIGFFGDDPRLFGIDINSKKKISYASSFGTIKEDQGCPQYVKYGLSSLDYISVRDEKSKNLVKCYSGREAEVVLDPTLMWDFNKDSNIVRPNIKEKYLVIYGSYFTKELIIGAQEYCKTHGLKIICLNSLDDAFEWCDYTINQDELTPLEWAGYFKYADVIMTCTFHGLMFALLFNKKVAFNPTDFIIQKSASFINELELGHVLIDITSFEGKINWNWNYEEINKRLMRMKEKSIKYLDRAIKNE